MRKVLGLVGLGAALTYFFDPAQGRRRRAMARDRVAAFFRRRARESGRLGRSAAAQAEGLAQKAKHIQEEPKPQPDDVTLTRKVETEIFRDAEIPKGQINVNAENGKIYLRGEVEKPELIKDLEKRARKVQGVQDVENLPHLPGTE
ncbi:MAG TPA: BON domain-containing protein, partial [Gaiellaceae bacterium]|nr:BON domain-containing protein [Gaiellaceae bacterium]